MQRIINPIKEIFARVIDFIRSFYEDSQVSVENDEFGIINPGREFDSYQVIVPQDYEFTEEEKLSLLRIHDYIHLRTFVQKQLGERG